MPIVINSRGREVYEPTEEEIALEAKQIRAGWTDKKLQDNLRVDEREQSVDIAKHTAPEPKPGRTF